MADIKQPQGTRTSLTSASLATLGSANYCVSSTYTANTNKPLDVVIEVEVATTNTPSGTPLVAVFLKESLDGTNFRSGPETGTTTTDEPDLLLLGVVPVNTSSTTHRGTFSVVEALGFVPHSFKVVTKNQVGVALTSGALYTAEVTGTVT